MPGELEACEVCGRYDCFAGHDAPAQAAEPEDGGFTCRECGYSAHLDSLMAVHQRETGHRKPASEMAAGRLNGRTPRVEMPVSEPAQPPVPSPGEFEEALIELAGKANDAAVIAQVHGCNPFDGKDYVAAVRAAHARALRAAEEGARRATMKEVAMNDLVADHPVFRRWLERELAPDHDAASCSYCTREHLKGGGRVSETKKHGPGFYITGGKGFHIVFANGWTVSVQFGPGNYCSNYDRQIGQEDARCGRDGSHDAEVAYWNPAGEMQEFPESGDTVIGRRTPAQVLALLNDVAGR